MSIFNWFTSSKQRRPVSTPESSGLGAGLVDATLPLMPTDRLRVKHASAAASHLPSRKSERHERRELLYNVVRDSMIRAGVLAASYKFKVLSLDTHGLQYLVMMDLLNQSAGDAIRLAEIESVIAQTAKMRHDITVTAVYWRVNEQVTAGLSQSHAVRVHPRHPKAADPQAPALAAVPTHRPAQPLAYEPLQEDEVAAFKRALANVTPAAAHWASGQIVTSGRRNPTPPDEFEDTQMLPTHERASPLSMTQYGELN